LCRVIDVLTFLGYRCPETHQLAINGNILDIPDIRTQLFFAPTLKNKGTGSRPLRPAANFSISSSNAVENT
jgi:hypothetical protein